MSGDGEDLFWALVEPLLADPAVRRSTMMGLPCLRLDGRFFASLDRRTGALLVKLPELRVAQLIAAGAGEPFAPAGRTFREWVAVPQPDRRRWCDLLAEAKAYADNTPTAAGAPNHGNPGFAGFGEPGLAFLAGLAGNNSKEFFDAHRDVYRREVLEPSKTFVVALADALRPRVGPDLRADPRVGGSLFRINNDLRFQPHQPPYKTHLDVALWVGEHGPRSDPALLVRIAPAGVHLGTGVMALHGAALERYRAALGDPAEVAVLDREVQALLTAGATLSEPDRRRPPPRLGASGPAARYAVRDGFHLMRVFRRPAAVISPALVGWCAERLAPFAGVHRWLVDHTT